MFEDKQLQCCDCANAFVFSAGEQEFFATKGLSNQPKRCENCRVICRVSRAGKSADNVSKAVCFQCQSEFLLPFRPTGYKPTFCNACFRAKKVESQTDSTLVTA